MYQDQRLSPSQYLTRDFRRNSYRSRPCHMRDICLSLGFASNWNSRCLFQASSWTALMFAAQDRLRHTWIFLSIFCFFDQTWTTWFRTFQISLGGKMGDKNYVRKADMCQQWQVVWFLEHSFNVKTILRYHFSQHFHAVPGSMCF